MVGLIEYIKVSKGNADYFFKRTWKISSSHATSTFLKEITEGTYYKQLDKERIRSHIKFKELLWGSKEIDFEMARIIAKKEIA
ncbi:MAG: hypothetical protein ACTJGH_00295 [Peptoniphilaceae bacterium]